MTIGEPLRVAVIGVGRRGREHLETLAAMPDRYRLVAVCDPSETATQSAAAPDVSRYSAVEDLFAREQLDAVVIATPPDTHHLIVRRAAHMGIHMLIETPLALTRKMMDVISDVVTRSGLKAEVGENMWRRPSDRLAKNAITAGLIGRVLRVSSYYDDAAENCPYHTISRMRFLVDAEVTEVQARSQGFDGIGPIETGRERITEETWTQAQLRFSNGVVGSCTYVTYWTRPLRTGHPRFTSVEGTDGFLVTGLWSPNMLRRVEGGRAVDYPLEVETTNAGGVEVPLRFSYGDTDPPVEFLNLFSDRPLLPLGNGWEGLARADELESLYRAVTENAEPKYRVDRARRDQELAILLTESARRREPLTAHFSDGADTPWEAEQHEAFRRRFGVDPFEDFIRTPNVAP